jgi:hypothetical protein
MCAIRHTIPPKEHQPMKQATIQAHGLEFALTMEPDITEDAFKKFCANLAMTIEDWEAEEAAKLHRGEDCVLGSPTTMAQKISWGMMPETATF